MNKSLVNQKVKAILPALNRVAIAIILVLVLKFTGALSGITYITQVALLKTGFADVNAENAPEPAVFDYNFTLKDLEGNTVDFKDFKGKVIFLNLWATWCGPCRAEMPSIHNLYTSIDKDKVAFVMLSIDTGKNHHKVVSYIQDRGFTFPVYTPAGYLPKHLQVPSIPTTFIISKDGKVVSKNAGAANYDTEKFRQFLQGLADE